MRLFAHGSQKAVAVVLGSAAFASFIIGVALSGGRTVPEAFARLMASLSGSTPRFLMLSVGTLIVLTHLAYDVVGIARYRLGQAAQKRMVVFREEVYGEGEVLPEWTRWPSYAVALIVLTWIWSAALGGA